MSFLDFFPIPKFLEMRPMGLALTDRYIHAIEFVRKGRGLELGRFGVRDVPLGAIKEGYVQDKKAVIDVLRSLQKELSMEFVSAALPEEKVYLFKTELPKVSEGNLREAIELRLEENVPIAAAEAIFDYAIIPGTDKGEHLDVSVTVLPFKVVSTYLEVIKSAGLQPVSFGVEAVSLSRALIPRDALGTFMVVNFGETRTGLSIVSRGVVQFSLMIPIGGDSVTGALEKHFSIDTAGAKKIKTEKGFVKNRENTTLFLSLMDSVSAIKDEVGKLFIYWQTRQNPVGTAKNKIEKIILCGRDSNLVGFDEYLSTAVKVPVEIGNVWRNAFSADSYIPGISFLDSFDYGSAIGLALPNNSQSHA